MPFSLKRSLSLVNAAFTAFGVAVTVGHALEPVRLNKGVCSTSYIGNQTVCNGFFECFKMSLLSYRRAVVMRDTGCAAHGVAWLVIQLQRQLQDAGRVPH